MCFNWIRWRDLLGDYCIQRLFLLNEKSEESKSEFPGMSKKPLAKIFLDNIFLYFI
ncbi:hypothetical protein KSU1_D0932 [Candidatus Jettenia caeni]|uniref:Uncharacterized protein n=1 Tax=Candidatus Jettenia caeni TaxID=247490 RepID=I3IR96_9BACT|nr:hypothetical protein KSU1_D0932 [Candidatus Jettenia caeni]